MKIQVKLELEGRKKKKHFILTEKQPTKQHPRSDRRKGLQAEKG